MVAFAGERVLELEAPIRNDGTKATLAGWGRTQAEVEGGRRRLEPAMVRMCFEYLFSKVMDLKDGVRFRGRGGMHTAPFVSCRLVVLIFSSCGECVLNTIHFLNQEYLSNMFELKGRVPMVKRWQYNSGL